MYTVKTFNVKTNEVERTNEFDDLTEAERYVKFSNKLNALDGKLITKLV